MITEQTTPSEIKSMLDAHIVGQEDAKKAVSIAIRNRLRRQMLLKDPATQAICEEITPGNILMMGPTGVGKTEIARRLAKLLNAPFIKVEATKFTEVGYVGRDVESIIRDLIEMAIKQERELARERVTEEALKAAQDRILDKILPKNIENPSEESVGREVFRRKLQEGQLDDQEIEIDLSSPLGVEIMGPPGMEEMTQQLQSLFQSFSNETRKRSKKMKVADALKAIQAEQAHRLIDEETIKQEALSRVEQNGIVFIDEIDKITRSGDTKGGGDISREGVQRDLLPLIEGCSVNTKYGTVRTDHILFIASGAFHVAKPSDLIPELQGRLPIRVELKALSVEDFIRILTEPKFSLTEQYEALLKADGLKLNFTKTGIARLAEIAWQLNESQENIGARRLYTVLERLLEEASFSIPDPKLKQLKVDKTYVDKRLCTFLTRDDLSKYIL